jgi:4-deoxy-L-threo-5-hexosulose-uronate ketol-isomerase
MTLTRHLHSPEATASMTTQELREAYTETELFAEGETRLSYWEQDRTLIGASVPTGTVLELPVPEMVGTGSFCERRELGILNLGGPGHVEVGHNAYEMDHLDGLYVGRGEGSVKLASRDADKPARFYLLSYPAHAAYPTKKIERSSVEPLELGTAAGANQRKLYKVIQPETVQSCQLVMGYTSILEGSAWNTMPPHTHVRRSEVYLYFAMKPETLVIHLMGRPAETKHLVMRNEQAVLSPCWSIHAGAGTGPYSFVWGMGGENQDFTDMQGFDLRDLM